MALSDDLAKLAARAKEAEDRFAAAQRDAHAKVKDDVKTARASLDKHTDQLRQTAEANRGKLAQWWNDVQKSWDEQIASIRRDPNFAAGFEDYRAGRAPAFDKFDCFAYERGRQFDVEHGCFVDHHEC